MSKSGQFSARQKKSGQFTAGNENVRIILGAKAKVWTVLGGAEKSKDNSRRDTQRLRQSLAEQEKVWTILGGTGKSPTISRQDREKCDNARQNRGKQDNSQQDRKKQENSRRTDPLTCPPDREKRVLIDDRLYIKRYSPLS